MDYSQILDQLEAQRKVIQKRMMISLGVTIGAVILGLILAGQNGIFFGLIAGMIVAGVLVSDSLNRYKNLFKSQLMPLLIAKTGINLKYEYKSGISQEVVMKSKLFKRPDKYHCEDLMFGDFDGVNFLCSDVRMEERRVRKDAQGRTIVTYEPFFTGRWFIYEFNKEFNGIIQVREDSFLAGPQWGLDVKKISLEDVEFNKKFKTYSTNQHDAFYVLTPTLLEKIKYLERRFPGKIYFSFIGSELHIGIDSSKNSFEPPIFQPLDDKFVDSQVQDIMILKDIVNELRLNNRIFK